MRRIGAVALACLLVAACQPDITSSATDAPRPSGLASPGLTTGPGETAGPSATVLPTASPEPTPTPVATPTTGPGTLSVLLPGSAIEVRVAELNLRQRPSTSAQRIEILKRGQVLIVVPYDGLWFGVGPVKRNGYTWYPVMKLQTGDADGDLPPLPTRPILIGTEVEVGWVATDDGEETYVQSLPPRCPGTVNLVNVEGMLSAERLACFGGGSIVLEGVYGCPTCGATLPPTVAPLWLGYQEALSFLSVDPPGQIGPLVLRFPPDGPDDPAQGSIIRVRVHVDDPAAATCTGTWPNANDEMVAVPPATMVTYCREQLVVESYEVLGVDPDFNT
jgi:hypothetical protein